MYQGIFATEQGIRVRIKQTRSSQTVISNRGHDTNYSVLPTATFRLLRVFIVLRHERRQVVHFGVNGTPNCGMGGAADHRDISMG